ncbi:uncharacterized protein LOC129291838 isoform X2 [Prosopis cineraria]|uniref:uncharacterized protein LOC129291838 isoform X2 n=1 Tax=Prosopis cineraria TaxID=364024 RepID=UPI0024106C46|nr:uncharacterized protein LOC129291838 isoform X2 [Prosopis cineraria]
MMEARPNQEETRESIVDTSEIIYGLGAWEAEKGDKVRIKCQLYSERGEVEYEPGPLELTLGVCETKDTYGKGSRSDQAKERESGLTLVVKLCTLRTRK